MAVNWLEVAKKMAEDARAQLALDRKRLQEILAERGRQQSAQGSQTNAQRSRLALLSLLALKAAASPPSPAARVSCTTFLSSTLTPLAKHSSQPIPGTSAVAAARHVLIAAQEHIRNRESFAVETTLSGQGYLRIMIDARARGFEVVLVYIGTENVETNLARIKNPVLAGGHDVPEEDVRRRYTRSFENLPTAIERADHTILFDNSFDEGYRLIAVLSPSVNQWFDPVPDWATANRRS